MAGLVFLIFFVLLALGYPIIMCMIGGAVTPLAMDAVGATSIAALSAAHSVVQTLPIFSVCLSLFLQAFSWQRAAFLKSCLMYLHTLWA